MPQEGLLKKLLSSFYQHFAQVQGQEGALQGAGIGPGVHGPQVPRDQVRAEDFEGIGVLRARPPPPQVHDNHAAEFGADTKLEIVPGVSYLLFINLCLFVYSLLIIVCEISFCLF